MIRRGGVIALSDIGGLLALPSPADTESQLRRLLRRLLTQVTVEEVGDLPHTVQEGFQVTMTTTVHYVCDPIPSAKHPVLLWEQHPSEEELLAKDVVEDGEREE